MLITQLVVESHRQTPVVKVAGKIQKVHLKVGTAITRYRRAHTDVGDPRPGFAIDFRADQVNPAQRHTTTLELHIGGGRTQLTRQLLTMQYPSSDLERTTKHAFGQGKIRRSQGLAYLGTADPDAIYFNGLRRFYSKSIRRAGLLQEVKIADPVKTEAKIVAYFEVLNAEAVDQHGFDETRGTQLAQSLIEGQAKYPVNAFGTQQLEFVTQSGQTCRSGLGSEELTRLRLENHHTAGHTQFDGTLAQTRQDSLVAAVNAVEIANRGDAAPMFGAQVVKASNQLHNALLAHKVADYNHTRPWATGNTPRPDEGSWRGPRKQRSNRAYIMALRAKSLRRKPSNRSMAK
ncbi:hypothetical protein ALP46_05429 [Pseudomonas amygdali pv. myricae]|nr:hypothetical protein ALP46_05429 [Pseudomonas amygdali pv. myricae]